MHVDIFQPDRTHTQVPASWAQGRTFTSVSAWTTSFTTHMIRLYKWCNGERPDAISLAEFKRPGALLTAVLQVNPKT